MPTAVDAYDTLKKASWPHIFVIIGDLFMNRILLAAASVAVLSAFSVPAQASHIFVTNVGINGSPLDSV